MRKSSIFTAILCILMVICSSGCGVKNYLYNYVHLNRPRYIDHSIVADAQPIETIKVLSYNIKYALKVDQAINIIRENEDLIDSDIILLQEMDLAGVKKIAQKLQYNYSYYPATIHPIHKKDFGNAVLSKWPILSDKKIILPSFNSKRQRIAVGATILINNEKIEVFSVHMGIFVKPDQRKQIVNLIVDSVEKDIEYCIAGGDFNTFTKADKKNINSTFLNAEYQLATRGIGWTNKHWYLLNKKTELDHIYVKGMRVRETGKIIDRSASDHLPIWSELALERDSDYSTHSSETKTRIF